MMQNIKMLKNSIFISINLLFTIISIDAEKLIIDTDAGVDDAIGIFMLLRAERFKDKHVPKFEIIGITCTYGNTHEENVELNVLKTLTIANRSDIPVYGGAKKPLIGNVPSEYHYGKDGFGDTGFDREITARMNKSMLASVALVELSKKHQGNVSIVVCGPTTNVALAIALDPNFTKRIKHFYVMGSSTMGIGNIGPNIEFNFGADAESNFIFLSSTTSSQLTLFPWEAGLNAHLSKAWRINVLGKYDSVFINFINKIEEYSLNKTSSIYVTSDAMNIATTLWPTMVKSFTETHVTAVIDGKARGSVIPDYRQNKKLLPPNAKIIESIDTQQLKEALIYYLTCDRVNFYC